MGDYYGYDPSQYRKNYGFISNAATTIGQGIISAAEYNEVLAEERAKAEKLLKEQKAIANIVYKTCWENIKEKAQPLLENKIIDDKTFSIITKPITNIDPAQFVEAGEINSRLYIDVLTKAYDGCLESLKDYETKYQSGKVQSLGQQARVGAPVPSAEKIAAMPLGGEGEGAFSTELKKLSTPPTTEEEFQQNFGEYAAQAKIQPTKEQVEVQTKLSGLKPAQKMTPYEQWRKELETKKFEQQKQKDIVEQELKEIQARKKAGESIEDQTDEAFTKFNNLLYDAKGSLAKNTALQKTLEKAWKEVNGGQISKNTKESFGTLGYPEVATDPDSIKDALIRINKQVKLDESNSETAQRALDILTEIGSTVTTRTYGEAQKEVKQETKTKEENEKMLSEILSQVEDEIRQKGLSQKNKALGQLYASGEIDLKHPQLIESIKESIMSGRSKDEIIQEIITFFDGLSREYYPMGTTTQ